LVFTCAFPHPTPTRSSASANPTCSCSNSGTYTGPADPAVAAHNRVQTGGGTMSEVVEIAANFFEVCQRGARGTVANLDAGRGLLD
jgi:hypothetical protein